MNRDYEKPTWLNATLVVVSLSLMVLGPWMYLSGVLLPDLFDRFVRGL